MTQQMCWNPKRKTWFWHQTKIDPTDDLDNDMKWFKHMTNSHDDEGLAHIIDVYGAKGFGIWWLLLEIIAGQMDKTDKCSVEYPEKRWCKLLGTRKEYLRQILTSFADHLDIIVRSSSDD